MSHLLPPGMQEVLRNLPLLEILCVSHTRLVGFELRLCAMVRCPLLKVTTIVSGEIFVLPLLKRARVLEIMKCKGNLL